MLKPLIIKTGSTLPELRLQRGDFEDWIMAGMGLRIDDVLVVDVRDGSPLPAYDEISAVVVTGSHAMVTEHPAWSERSAAWLAGAVEQRLPVLGICYGHQLLAYALGGEVGDNPNGREYGTLEVRLEEQARQDPLLGGLMAEEEARPLNLHLGHVQSVLRTPGGAVCLASSSRDPVQAFRVGECAWGVQFHPEFDAHIVRAYLRHNQDVLRLEGQDPDELAAASVDAPYGSQILKRFLSLA